MGARNDPLVLEGDGGDQQRVRREDRLYLTVHHLDLCLDALEQLPGGLELPFQLLPGKSFRPFPTARRVFQRQRAGHEAAGRRPFRGDITRRVTTVLVQYPAPLVR